MPSRRIFRRRSGSCRRRERGRGRRSPRRGRPRRRVSTSSSDPPLPHRDADRNRRSATLVPEAQRAHSDPMRNSVERVSTGARGSEGMFPCRGRGRGNQVRDGRMTRERVPPCSGRRFGCAFALRRGAPDRARPDRDRPNRGAAIRAPARDPVPEGGRAAASGRPRRGARELRGGGRRASGRPRPPARTIRPTAATSPSPSCAPALRASPSCQGSVAPSLPRPHYGSGARCWPENRLITGGAMPSVH